MFGNKKNVANQVTELIAEFQSRLDEIKNKVKTVEAEPQEKIADKTENTAPEEDDGFITIVDYKDEDGNTNRMRFKPGNPKDVIELDPLMGLDEDEWKDMFTNVIPAINGIMTERRKQTEEFCEHAKS